MSPPDPISRRLRDLAEARDWTVKDLQRQAGVVNALYRSLCGQGSMTLTTLQRLAAAVGHEVVLRPVGEADRVAELERQVAELRARLASGRSA